MRYTMLFALALALALGCTHEIPNPTKECADERMTQACDNWMPGYIAVCYEDGPDPQPADECAWLPSNRFGAPDPIQTKGTDNTADWWCCPGNTPILDAGHDARPDAVTFDSGPTGGGQ
jgi:hypothetical protein